MRSVAYFYSATLAYFLSALYTHRRSDQLSHARQKTFRVKYAVIQVYFWDNGI